MVMRWLKDWLFGDSPEQRREKERKAEWEAHAAENRIKAIHAARSFIAQSPVIFDTETTGLDKTDEVVEIACVDIDGNVLMNALVKPTCSVSDGARAVHGIGDDQLAASRSMGDLAPYLQRVFANRLVLAYGFDFDIRLLRQSMRAVGRTWSKDWSAIGRASALEEHCVMFWYSRFSVGTSRRRVSLANALKQCGITVEGRAHRALADAEATRLVLRHMAAATP